MYTHQIAQTIYSNKFLAAAGKLYELIKLQLRPSFSKDDNCKEYLPYIIDTISKGYTVLDIGCHKRRYIFDLLKLSKLPGRMILFENASPVYKYFFKIKQLLHLANVFIEQSFAVNTNSDSSKSSGDNKSDRSAQATIIDFTLRINKGQDERAASGTVDSYCASNCIIPALIKFKLERNDLNHLKGSGQILKKYKPDVLIECAEGTVSRETLSEAFDFLADLNYAGYFILDTIKVPLRSFDFNIYQNDVLGFYCNNFIFK
jgi:hypothetical protein